MGSINLGDIFASLSLDNREYLNSIKNTEAAHQILSANIKELNKDFSSFLAEMDKIGVSSQKVDAYFREMVREGTSVGAAFKDVAASVAAARAQLLAMGNDPVKIAALDVANQGKLAEQVYLDLQHMERVYQEELTQRGIIEKEQDKARAVYAARQMEELKAIEAMYLRQEEEAAANNIFGGGGGGGRFGLRVNGGGVSPHGWINSPIALGGAAAGFLTYESIKKAIDFESALTRVDVIMGVVSKDMRDQMTQAAKDLAVETGLSATKIVEQFGTMRKAGLDSTEMFKVLPEITRLSVVSGQDLHETFRQVLTVVDAMRLPVSKVGELTDMLAKANQLARGSVEQFAEALQGKAAGAIRQANIPLGQALALIVAMSQRGVEANVAQTALTQIITKLGVSAEKYGKVLLDVNGQSIRWDSVVKDSNNNMRPLVDILTTLDKAFVGRSTGEINKFLQTIGLAGQRDVYLKSLLGVSDALRDINKEFQNTAGQGVASFDKAMTAPHKQIEQLEQAFHNLGINVGELFLPAMEKLIPPLTSFVELIARAAGGMSNFLSYLPGIKLVGLALDTLSKSWGWVIDHLPGGGSNKPEPKPATARRSYAEIQEEGHRMTLEHSLAGVEKPLFEDPDAEEKARKKAQALQIALDSARALYSRFYEAVVNDAERFATSDTTFAQKAIANIDALFRTGADPAKIKSVISTSFEALREFEHKMEAEQKDAQNRARLFMEYWKAMEKEAKRAEEQNLTNMKVQELTVEGHKEIGERGQKASFKEQTVSGFAEMKSLNDLMLAYKRLGMEIEVGPDEGMRLMLHTFHQVVDSAKQLDTVRTAWAAVDGAISKLSKISLPEAIKEYNYLEKALRSRGASEGEIMKVTEKRLKDEIEMAAMSGKDATKLQNQLTVLEIRQKILRDTSLSVGELTHGIAMTLNSGWEQLFNNIGRNIIQMKSFAEVAKSVLNQITSSIFGQIFGLFGQFIGNQLSSSFMSFFKAPAPTGFYGSNVTMYASGSWDTGPKTHLAMIHPHEMVLNETVADQVRSNGFGGSGGDTVIHIDFSGSHFSGVTQNLVDSVMNKAVRSARLSGTRFSPVG